MAAYYNEIDPYAAQWLRNLIAAGHIAGGDVDERSIKEVRADDLHGYTQCHFFAGIGGWSLALRMAGWDDARPVWTGSCPCQPFSNAGKQTAQSDERHLWPDWFRLIRESSPPVIFGEQVADAIAYGWLDDAFDDLENASYAVGAAVLPACSVGSQHKRRRLFFVSHHCGASSARGNQDVWRDGQNEEVESYRRDAHRESALPEFRVLADGIPRGMAKSAIKGFGNAIVPRVAAQFIRAAA